MDNKKRVFALTMLLIVFIIGISFVSAGFWDFFKFGKEKEKLEGELYEERVDVTLQMGNALPIIESWTEPDSIPATPEIDVYIPNAGSTTTVNFIVTMYDDNGWQDLQDGTVTVQFLKTGEETRSGSCTAQASGAAKNLNFTCSVNMWYYDAEGLASNDTGWNITVYANDGVDNATNNGQTSQGTAAMPDPNYPYFSYGSLLDIEIADSNDPTPPEDTLEWTDITASSINVTANNYLIVENLGNVEIEAAGTSYLTILGRNLISATDPYNNTDKIEPDSFAVDEEFVLPDPCNLGEPLNYLPVALNITGATLLRGLGVTRNLYFCLQSMNPSTGNPVSTDIYGTRPAPNNWELDATE